MSSAGLGIDGVRATCRFPSFNPKLLDDYAIKLSDDAIAKYIQRYQVMLGARQQDPEALRRQYDSVAEIILSIDGLQPEKGTRDPLRREGANPEASVVRRGLDLGDRGRGSTLDRSGQGVG